MEARLTLGADAQVIATRHPMRLAEAAVVKISTEARFEFSAKARYAPPGQEEFHPRLAPIAAVAVITKEFDNTRHDFRHFVVPDEGSEPFGESWTCPQPTTYPKIKADFAFVIGHGNQSDVVNLVLRATLCTA